MLLQTEVMTSIWKSTFRPNICLETSTSDRELTCSLFRISITSKYISVVRHSRQRAFWRFQTNYWDFGYSTVRMSAGVGRPASIALYRCYRAAALSCSTGAKPNRLNVLEKGHFKNRLHLKCISGKMWRFLLALQIQKILRRILVGGSCYCNLRSLQPSQTFYAFSI